MKIAEIRELSTEELAERIETEVAAYNNAKFNHNIAPVENVSLIKKQRRDIARMKCELSQRNK
ncbi:MAG: 50S ribosomal protein L29 [Bacteroidaceae bacterium]|jgi:large subunit ribosomal protein L29|nr:50S ribosomal protein L29 [Bacteroidaceae bacterium]